MLTFDESTNNYNKKQFLNENKFWTALNNLELLWKTKISIDPFGTYLNKNTSYKKIKMILKS